MSLRKLLCLDCGQAGRIARDRTGADPVCDICGSALLTTKPRPVDAALLAKATKADQLPLLVDFWAPWCAPCRVMAPEFQKAAASLKKNLRSVKLDTQAYPSAVGRWKIRGIPTLILFQDGRETARLAGARKAAEIIRFAEKARVI